MKMKEMAIALSLALGSASVAHAADGMDCCKGKEFCCKKHDGGAAEAGHKDRHHDESEAKPEPKAR